MTVYDLIEKIEPASDEAYMQSKQHWDSIAKPLHSLGKLEDSIMQIAAITGNANVSLKKKGLIVMCADNGVVEEGVTQSGQEVTAIVAENFLTTQATAAIMCKKTGADIFPIDIGMATDTKVLRRKIAYGTKNMTKGPAMTREEAQKAILVGIELVKEKKQEGYEILATGEMGIGNTTTSSALAAVFMDLPVEEVTGRGAGLSSEGLERKIAVIKQAIAVNQPDKTDAIDVLAKLGGLDIAGLTGVFLGGAIYHVPIVIDGFISAAAALTAMKIAPLSRDYMLASHVSKEPAAKRILKELHASPLLTCDMCLGEGTGAVALFPILDLAVEVYHSMSTFQDVNIEEYQPLV